MSIIDKGQILAEGEDQAMAADRTRRNVCARCGLGSSKHKKGPCKDGAGSYTWCHTREDTKTLIAGLEDFLAKAAHHKREGEKPENADARRLVDIMVTASTGSLGEETARQFLARMRGVDERALGDLGPNELGLLDDLLTSGLGSVERLVASVARLCGWPVPRALEALKRAEANGWVQKHPDAPPAPAAKA